MNEKPILFSGPMIRAILEGRKTMTRRVIKPQPPAAFYAPEEGFVHCFDDGRVSGRQRFVAGADAHGEMIVDVGWEDFPIQSPYRPGQMLWVRESHCFYPTPDCPWPDLPHRHKPHDGFYDCVWAFYREGFDRSRAGIRWRPSIHMPRWASRISLRVTDVRVERLQTITTADIYAEGVTIPRSESGRYLLRVTGEHHPGLHLPRRPPETWGEDEYARAEWAALWDSINAKRGHGWETNPWVWVVEFEVAR